MLCSPVFDAQRQRTNAIDVFVDDLEASVGYGSGDNLTGLTCEAALSKPEVAAATQNLVPKMMKMAEVGR